MPDLAYLIRSIALTGFVEVCQSLGIDPYRMLEVIGLPASCLQEQDTKINSDVLSRLLEGAAAAAGVDDFGLRLVEWRDLSILGPVGLVVREQPNVGQAILALQRYIRLHNTAATLSIEEVGELVILKQVYQVERPAAVRQSTELMVGVTARILRTLIGRNWHPQAAYFTHGPPLDGRLHNWIFGPHVEFGHDYNAIVVTKADLQREISSSSPQMAAYVTRFVDRLAEGTSESHVEAVRRLIGELLPTGRCSSVQVAARLGVDRRTVNARLAREGYTFSKLLAETRRQLAHAYLDDAGRPLTSIADALGFSGASAFTRWFQSQFGQAPSAWRRARRKAG